MSSTQPVNNSALQQQTLNPLKWLCMPAYRAEYALEGLLARLQSPDPTGHFQVLRELGSWRKAAEERDLLLADRIDVLRDTARLDPRSEVRRRLASILKGTTQPILVSLLCDLAEGDPNYSVRFLAVSSLHQAGSTRALRLFLNILLREQSELCVRAFVGLRTYISRGGQLGEPELARIAQGLGASLESSSQFWQESPVKAPYVSRCYLLSLLVSAGRDEAHRIVAAVLADHNQSTHLRIEGCREVLRYCLGVNPTNLESLRKKGFPLSRVPRILLGGVQAAAAEFPGNSPDVQSVAQQLLRLFTAWRGVDPLELRPPSSSWRRDEDWEGR